MESLKVSKRLGWTLLEGRGKKHAENVQIPGTEWTWHDNIHDNVIQWLFLGRFFFEHFGGWGVLRLVFVCGFFVQVVVGWRSFDNVFRCFHVWRVAEFANVGIVESEETRVTRENGREYSIGRVPAKCYFLIFQKPAIFCILKYRLPKCILFVGRVNIEETWQKVPPFFWGGGQCCKRCQVENQSWQCIDAPAVNDGCGVASVQVLQFTQK